MKPKKQKPKIHYVPDYFLNPTHPITVILVGCGGTGAEMLAILAKMNYGLNQLGHAGLHVKVFDPDHVTEPNIGRQPFSESDLGLNKAIVKVTRINRFFGLSWEASDTLYKGKESANILITCVDTAAARVEIGEKVLKKIE